MTTPTPTDSPTGPVGLPGTGELTESTGSGAGDSGDAEASARGRLDIALGVVRKIAEHAADLTEGTTTRHRRLAGVALGDTGSSAKVSGYGDQVDLRLEVPLAYPAPIVTTVDAVRGNVRERVQELTGYRVRSCDVTVAALTDPTSRTE